ncbi:ACT domain-containing protein [Anoxynatronum sibiricum]|uniref:ACT domain-containing protein n=1 Tax=Anoxynatronum sibiricum TaxID=210623 RepID=A0ABU9VVZ9_9CLOT
MLEKKLTMIVMNETYGVCRLDNNQPVPEWAKNSRFYSITRTFEELSIVCSQEIIPDDVKCEKDWRMLKVEGPLDFSLIGILSSISTVLAQSKISIFAISTFDTDYILLKNKDFDNAIEALSNEGYEITA